MERIDSILVVVDRNSMAQRTVAKAADLARRFDSRLELFLCDAERAYALKREYVEQAAEEAKRSCIADARRFLEALRKPLGSTVRDVTVDAVCESPLYEGIVGKVQNSHPDLVLRGVDPEGAGGAPHITDWDLVRACPVPLMLTRGRTWRVPPRIGAAVDISGEESPAVVREVLRTAKSFASGCGGTLEILFGCGEQTGDAAERHIETCRSRLERHARQAGVRPDQVHVIPGEPAQTLPRFAAGRYDLFVMGALTHRKTPAALVGTLTGRLLETLDCDFVLVKTPDLAARAEGGTDADAKQVGT
ncbi:MAG: universal stress protein [Pseudomonadota bacterium]|nr:MAG: hypothetical protein DIU56_00140 [Pseudomonadota bacterium]